VRAAAPCDVGTDRGGSLAGRGKGKEAESERTIATRFVVEGRTEVKLMKREPESMQKLWQTTTSTALFR
jgi:hypothetical protein